MASFSPPFEPATNWCSTMEAGIGVNQPNRASNSLCEAVRVQRLVTFSGGIAKEGIQARASLGIIQPLFPRFVILARQQESRKIRQFRLFLFRQRFTNLDNFLDGTHGVTIQTNAGFSKSIRIFILTRGGRGLFSGYEKDFLRSLDFRVGGGNAVGPRPGCGHSTATR